MSASDHQVQLPFAQSHAFIIGINDYRHLSKLSTAVNDAKEMAHLLAAQHHFNVYAPLLDPTGEEILRWLREVIPQTVQEEDRVLFYFAGHGIALDGEDGPNGYLVPVDARQGDRSTLIPMTELHDLLTRLPCRHGLVILDCCFSGAFKWSAGFRDVIFDLPKVIYEERFWRYCKDPAWQVITSSAYDQKAVDIISNQSLGLREAANGKEHSPFANALFEALQGAADVVPAEKGDGVITATELYSYLRNTVETETAEKVKRQSPSLFNLHRHDKGEFIFLSPRHRFNLPPTPDRNPFMGLSSYNEDDAKVFYGRDRVTEALLKKVEEDSLIVVSGASGTGKSSVIKAGVLPQLRKKGYHILPIIRPGKEPMQTLQVELAETAERLRESPTVLVVDQYEELITRCLHIEEREAFEAQLAAWLTQYPDLRILLSIRSDFEPQFESAALAPWWEEGRYIVPAFSLEEIREVITRPAAQTVLFYEPEELVDKLEAEVSQAPGALPLLSFTLSELYHAYLKSGREDRALTLEDYLQLGGVIGALRTRADAVYLALEPDDQGSMRKLMLRMVSLEGGELAGKRVYAEELVFSNQRTTEQVRKIADRLVAARLVSQGTDGMGRAYVEPAHDALVRAWARLWEWIKTVGEEKITLQYKLSQAVNDYHELDREDSAKARNLLWNNNPRLDLLRAELEGTDHGLNALEEAFVKKSVDRRERIRRRNWIIAGAVMIGLAGLSVFAFSQQAIAKEQAQIAQDSTAAAQQQRLIAQMRTQEAQDSAQSAQLQRQIAQDSTIAAQMQRDLANTARKDAEARQKEAEAITMATVAGNLTVGEMGRRLRLGERAFANTRPLPPPSPVYQVLAATFYDQFADEEGVAHPLYIGDVQKRENLYGFHSSSFSPKGNYVLLAQRRDGGEADLVELRDRRGQLIDTLSGHQGELQVAAFTPDERLLLTLGQEDREVELWNTKGQLLHQFAHAGPITSAVFSRDGKYILTASQDRTVKLWNANGRLQRDFTGFGDAVNFAIFSPDGQAILTGSEDQSLRLWGLDGKMIQDFSGHISGVTKAVFSPNGQFIASRGKGDDGQSISLWRRSGAFIRQVGFHQYRVDYFEFSPDNERIVTGANDQAIKIWDVNGTSGDAVLFALDPFQPGRVHVADFTPDGHLVYTTQFRQTQLWNAKSGQIQSFSGNEYVAFAPDGQSFAVAAGEQTDIYNIKGEKVAELIGQRDDVKYLQFSADGRFLLTRSSDDIKVWDLRGALLKDIARLNRDRLSWAEIGFSPGGKHVLAFADRQLSVWDLEGNLCLRTPGEKLIRSADSRYLLTYFERTIEIYDLLQEKSYQIQAAGKIERLTFTPDGGHFLASYNDGPKPALYHWESGRSITLDGHFDGEPHFSPDGRSVITRDRNVTRIWTWDEVLRRGQAASSDTLLSKGVNSVFSPDGRYLLTHFLVPAGRMSRHELYLWDLGKREILFKWGFGNWIPGAPLATNEAWIVGRFETVQFSPDSRSVLIQLDKKAPSLWDIRGRKLADLELPDDSRPPAVLLFSPDGSNLLSNYYSQGIFIWDARGRLVRTAENSVGKSQKELQYSPDGRYFISNSGLWTKSGRQVSPLVENDVNSRVEFSPDGQYILANTTDGKLKIWNQRGELLTVVEGRAPNDGIDKAAYFPDNQNLLTVSRNGAVRLRPMVDRIYRYLQEEAVIPRLTANELEQLGLR